MNITQNWEQKHLYVALEGRLDSLTSPELETALAPSLDAANDLTIDMTKLEYISSAGLRILVAARKRISPRGKVTFRGVNEGIMEVFRLTDLDRIFTIEP